MTTLAEGMVWASRAFRFLASTLVVAGISLGCARASAPPGGPPDELPPFLVEAVPDTFARLEGWDRAVVFRFSERISERRSAGTWVDAVTVSPESGRIEVRHRRDALEIRPEDGFQPGRVYRVALRPVVRDLFGNVMLDPFELVFSTGPDFDSAVLAGLTWDRITGEILREQRVEAVSGTDTTVVHIARSDSTGIFTLRFLPPGAYTVTAYTDRNRNRRLDPPEPRGGEAVRLQTADTTVLSIPVLEPDTTPAALTGVALTDSLTIRLSFDDALDPEWPTDGVRWTLLRAVDSIPIQTGRGIFHQAEMEQLQAGDREAAGLPPEEEDLPARPGAGRQRATTPDGRPVPSRELFLLLSTPLQPGEAHIVEVEEVTNIQGVTGGGGSRTLEVPGRDTAAVDTTGVAAPDTLPDTLRTSGSPAGSWGGGGGGGAGGLRPRLVRLPRITP